MIFSHGRNIEKVYGDEENSKVRYLVDNGVESGQMALLYEP